MFPGWLLRFLHHNFLREKMIVKQHNLKRINPYLCRITQSFLLAWFFYPTSKYFHNTSLPECPLCSHITVTWHVRTVQAVLDLISNLNFTWNTVFRLKPLAAELRQNNLNISSRRHASTQSTGLLWWCKVFVWCRRKVTVKIKVRVNSLFKYWYD